MDYLFTLEYMKVNTKIYVKPQLTEIPIENTLAKTVNKVETVAILTAMQEPVPEHISIVAGNRIYCHFKSNSS